MTWYDYRSVHVLGNFLSQTTTIVTKTSDRRVLKNNVSRHRIAIVNILLYVEWLPHYDHWTSESKWLKENYWQPHYLTQRISRMDS